MVVTLIILELREKIILNRVENEGERAGTNKRRRERGREMGLLTPAGYDLTPVIPAFFASLIVSSVILGWRYRDMRNLTFGSILWRWLRCERACSIVVIGGTRFGMT